MLRQKLPSVLDLTDAEQEKLVQYILDKKGRSLAELFFETIYKTEEGRKLLLKWWKENKKA